MSQETENGLNELMDLYEVEKQNIYGMHWLLLFGFDKWLQEVDKFRKELAGLQAWIENGTVYHLQPV